MRLIDRDRCVIKFRMLSQKRPLTRILILFSFLMIVCSVEAEVPSPNQPYEVSPYRQQNPNYGYANPSSQFHDLESDPNSVRTNGNGEIVISTKASFKDFKCEWVETAEMPARPTATVNSLELPSPCQSRDSHYATKFDMICSGTTLCHVVFAKGDTEKATDLFFENTMCLSSKGKCAQATDCVLRGGIFQENSAEMLFEGLKEEQPNSPKKYVPRKRGIQEPPTELPNHTPEQPRPQQNEHYPAPA